MRIKCSAGEYANLKFACSLIQNLSDCEKCVMYGTCMETDKWDVKEHVSVRLVDRIISQLNDVRKAGVGRWRKQTK